MPAIWSLEGRDVARVLGVAELGVSVGELEAVLLDAEVTGEFVSVPLSDELQAAVSRHMAIRAPAPILELRRSLRAIDGLAMSGAFRVPVIVGRRRACRREGRTECGSRPQRDVA